jgi:flagellar motor switch protein FliM
MDDKILSQDEINALFSAMSSDEATLDVAAEAETPPAPQAAGYDFRQSDRISKDQIRSLHLLHDYFVRTFASSLSTYLRAFVNLTLVSVDQVSYADFLRQLPDPTLFASVGMRPTDANLIIELNPSLAFPMIDILLGGPGRPPQSERTLTEIEMTIIEGVINLAIRDLREAWRPIMDVDIYLDALGTKPQTLQTLARTEAVVAVSLDMKIGENGGSMNLCIPSRMLKVIRNKFDQQWSVRRQKVAGSEAEKMLALLRPAVVGLRGEVRDSNLTVDDLLRITVGDVIQLAQRIDEPVTLCVAGNPKYLGHIVTRRGRKAFEVSQEIAT